MSNDPAPPDATAEKASIDDTQLARILENSLSGSEGAVVVNDPSSGLIRAISNPRLSFEQSFPPGSTIKPFTLLSAARSGAINAESRRKCSGGYFSPEYEIECSHPRSVRPFGPVEALAYSCNDYFAHLGERLSESSFLATLEAFGFGRRTGVNASNENGGKLRAGDWGPRKAVGESDSVLVTPIQLLVAYSAMFNGGKVIRPKLRIPGASLESGKVEITASLEMPDKEREILVRGMEGSLSIGTSSSAGFDTSHFRIIGKTGTSTSSNGWGTQGWFVGFAGKGKKPALGIVVLLKRAAGHDAAQVAANVLKALPETWIEPERSPKQAPPLQATLAESAALSPAVPESSDRTVRVQTTGDHRVLQLPLERYITGVLVAEYSVEDNFEALKAHAVASRSYALANLGRHGSEGFDFCSTTHCQRFSSDVPTLDQRRARADTSGLILVDKAGNPIEAFFHADCGGSTTSATALWGHGGRSYLRQVEDKYCAKNPKEWTDRLPARKLAAAFAKNSRSNAGDALRNIRVSARDNTGRAEWVTIEGDAGHTRRIRGWDFKMIVGRTLGWNVIKSSQFEVWREGEDFVFRGRGHGHGLGMCQTGAGALAASGANYEEILAHYFPGTLLSREASATQSLASEHFRIYFTPSTNESDVKEAFEVLERGYRDLVRRLEGASIPFPMRQPVEVTVSASTESYISATGMPGWTAAIMRGGKIISQPLSLLKKRGVLATALRHEYAHVAIELLSRGRAPRWFSEGLAAHFAGEGPLLADAVPTRLPIDALEHRISTPASAADMKSLYRQAYIEVRTMIRAKDESEVWRQLSRITAKEGVQSPHAPRPGTDRVLLELHASSVPLSPHTRKTN